MLTAFPPRPKGGPSIFRWSTFLAETDSAVPSGLSRITLVMPVPAAILPGDREVTSHAA
jgi:hypothetical protein